MQNFEENMLSWKQEHSLSLFEKAQRIIPGGVNSPVRAFQSVKMPPLFIKKGEGPYVFDEDNNRYLDYVLSWGPLIHGHAHPYIIEAITKAAHDGTSFGAPTKRELLLVEMIQKFLPSLEMIRLVNSGTEATMSAIRLARGYTKKNKIIKFNGCYHGHADTLLVSAGSGVATLGIPSSSGVTVGTVQDTLSLPYNDTDTFLATIEKNKDDLAAVIVEPVAGNMGCILPKPEFLTALREGTRKYRALLIFDEVMTGFRVAKGGAQEYFHIEPDLTCLGKVIGGGLPLAAYGGKQEIMKNMAPSGNIYQAGTLSGNPLAVSAGIASLELLDSDGFYQSLSQKTERLSTGLKSVCDSLNIPASEQHIGTMFTLFFNKENVENFEMAKQSDISMFISFFQNMLKRGFYFAPSAFEASFLSSMHTDEHIEQTLQAANNVLTMLVSK